jgi:hypothetical protein
MLAAIASVALTGCAPQHEALDGKVVLVRETNHAGVLVFASGRLFSEDSVVTGSTGAWHFGIASLGARYFVKAYAPSTLEKTQEIVLDVAEGESKVAPDIVFTPVGTMRGTVTVAGAPAEAARVSIEGGDLDATTDATGAFAFEAVRTGSHTLRVEVPGHAPVSVPDVLVTYANETDVPPVAVP